MRNRFHNCVAAYAAQMQHTIVGATPVDRERDAATFVKTQTEEPINCGGTLLEIHAAADYILAETAP